MLRKLLFALIILNSSLVGMTFDEASLLITQARQYVQNKDYEKARATFEKVLQNTEGEKSIMYILAAEGLGRMWMEVFNNYQMAFKYMQDAYNTCENKLAQYPQDTDLMHLQALLAHSLGMVYTNRPKKNEAEIVSDYLKAVDYLAESYDKVADDKMRGANAYSLAVIYNYVNGLDDFHEETIKYLKEAIKLADPERVEKAKKNLERILRLKQPVKIELQDKTIKKIDLDARDSCDGKKTLSELLAEAKAHAAEFIIARIMVHNNRNTGAFYCSANSLIDILWDPFPSFIKDTFSKATVSDGRPITNIEFFKWDPSQDAFIYFCNKGDLSDGYAGLRKKFFITAQDYRNPRIKAQALLALSELYYFGLGGDRDLQVALSSIDLGLQNKQLPEVLKRKARIAQATIWLDLGIENKDTNPNLFMRYVIGAEQVGQRENTKDAKRIQACALAELEIFYRKKNNLKQSLMYINKILEIKDITPKFRKHYTQLKKKIEAELKAPELPVPATSEPVAAAATTTVSHEKPRVQKTKRKQTSIPEKALIQQEASSTTSEPAPAPIDTATPHEKPLVQETQVNEQLPGKTIMHEETSFSAEEKLIADMIQMSKAESLLNDFEQKFADCAESTNQKQRLLCLKKVNELLIKIDSLDIQDEELQTKIAEARNKRDDAFRKQAAQEASASSSSNSSTTSSAASTATTLVILDLFGVENEVPETLKKRFEQIKIDLVSNAHCCGAEPIESSKYNIYRIRLGEDRLLYTITPHFIGLLGVVPRNETTYKKVDSKYKNKVNQYNDLVAMNSSQLTERIERERESGNEGLVNALTNLLRSIKKD